MSTTPTLRDAAQALADAVSGISSPNLDDRVEEALEALRAALTQGAGEAVEPVACLVRSRRLMTRADIAHDGVDHFSPWGEWYPATLSYGLSVTDPARNSGSEYVWQMQPLYAAPPAQQLQQAVARALAPIQQAIRDYHYALDTHQHGDIALDRAMGFIKNHLGMHWQQGKEAAIRAKGTQ